MFTNLLSKAEKHYHSAKPFVLYRKPMERSVKGIFQADDTLHYVDDFTEKGFIFAPFNAENKIVLIPVDEALEADFTAPTIINNYELDNLTDDTKKEFHLQLVKNGIQAIEAEQFKKVVLSRCSSLPFNSSPFTLFTALLSKYSNAFCYIYYHPKVGLWLGATPELLLKTENKQLKTMSLAGTQKYTGEENPTWGIKELEEQKLVTKYISDVLVKEVTQLKISETTSLKAGNLWHLRTTISGMLKYDTIKTVIDALHPTPAVCGLPKKPTKEFILKHENYNREYYTGFLGELNFKSETRRTNNLRNTENHAYKTIKNTTSLYVNLRCMKINNNTAIIYVGGGITKASNPEKEWEETRAKSETMLSVLKNIDN